MRAERREIINIKDAIETMKHWIEYEQNHKDKINKADELIEVQQTILDYIEELELQIKVGDR